MAKFKRPIKTRERLTSADAQRERINKLVKKFEYKDLLVSLLIIIFGSFLVGILIYAGISILL